MGGPGHPGSHHARLTLQRLSHSVMAAQYWDHVPRGPGGTMPLEFILDVQTCVLQP